MMFPNGISLQRTRLRVGGKELPFTKENIAKYNISKSIVSSVDKYTRESMVPLNTVQDLFYKAMAGVAVTSFGVAAYNKTRSYISKQRATPAGHFKAQTKYKQQAKKMINMFKDTPLESLAKQQTRNKNLSK